MKGPTNNPVAKHINRFNKPATHRDRTKYSRKEKHGKSLIPNEK